MAEGIEGKVIEKIGEEAIGNLSPLKRFWSVFKKIITAFIFLKWIWVTFVAWFDNVRRATIIQAMDKFPENKVWKTILWIKTWRYIYGIIIGLLLAYYYQADDYFMKFIDYAIQLFD